MHAGIPHPPGADTPNPPQSSHTPPEQTPPREQTPPWEQTPPPPEQTPPPGSRLQHTVYERPVHILLECILISIVLQISIDEGQELAAQWDCPFFETSAALRNFVDDTFHTLIREIRRYEREAELGPGKKQKIYHKKKQLEGFFHKLFKKSDS